MVIWIVLILIVFCLISFISYKLKRIFTREKFAFFFIAPFGSLCVLVIANIFDLNVPILIINLFREGLFLLEPVPVPELTVFEYIYVFLVLLLFLFAGIFFYMHWNGAKSVREENGIIPENIFAAALAFFHADARRISLRSENDDKDDDLHIAELQFEPLSWHQQAADLLVLWDSQIKINLNTDWYSQRKCFISTYGKNEQPLVVFCYSDLPPIVKLEEGVKFTLSELKCDNALFYLAVKDNVKSDIIEVLNQEIQVVSEEFLLDHLIDFEDYKNKIISEFAEEDFYQGCGQPLSNTYTEPSCTIRNAENNSEIEVDSIEGYIFSWMNDDLQHQQLAILGEYGQGKSVLCKRIAYRLMTEEKLSKRIPILISLSGKSPEQYENALDILGEWCSKNDFRRRALLKLFNAGRLLIILDGFDEMKLVGDAQMRREHFCRIWELSTKYSKLIITGRPNYFLNNDEMKSLLRLGTACESLTLNLFDRDRILKALRYLPVSTISSIMKEYDYQEGKGSFADLLKRPSLLAITGLQWKTISQNGNYNLNSAKVIGGYLDSCYERQREKKQEGHVTVLSTDDRAYFMQGIALGMLKKTGDYTNIISLMDLKDIVIKLIPHMPKEVSELSTESPKKKLKMRYDARYNEESILRDVVSCGVLVRDLNTYDSYRFAHKSFLELLIARYDALMTICHIFPKEDLRMKIVRSYNEALSLGMGFVEKRGNVDVGRFIREEIANSIDFSNCRSGNEKIERIYRAIRILPVRLQNHLFFTNIFGVCWFAPFCVAAISIIYAALMIFSLCSYTYNSLEPINGIILFFVVILILAIVPMLYVIKATPRLSYFPKLMSKAMLRLYGYFFVCTYANSYIDNIEKNQLLLYICNQQGLAGELLSKLRYTRRVELLNIHNIFFNKQGVNMVDYTKHILLEYLNTEQEN